VDCLDLAIIEDFSAAEPALLQLIPFGNARR
jgi:hypothetical protein